MIYLKFHEHSALGLVNVEIDDQHIVIGDTATIPYELRKAIAQGRHIVTKNVSFARAWWQTQFLTEAPPISSWRDLDAALAYYRLPPIADEADTRDVFEKLLALPAHVIEYQHMLMWLKSKGRQLDLENADNQYRAAVLLCAFPIPRPPLNVAEALYGYKKETIDSIAKRVIMEYEWKAWTQQSASLQAFARKLELAVKIATDSIAPITVACNGFDLTLRMVQALPGRSVLQIALPCGGSVHIFGAKMNSTQLVDGKGKALGAPRLMRNLLQTMSYHIACAEAYSTMMGRRTVEYSCWLR